ncbi:MAG TPA: ATP-binding cassette domain-containing protein, partial [Puia sp.]
MVSIHNLHFAYRGRKVFSGLDLKLSAGHIYGLLGRNGTGKSTLLRNMAGLLFPQEGNVEVMGYEPARRLPSFLQKIFLVPEDIQLPAVGLEQWL